MLVAGVFVVGGAYLNGKVDHLIHHLPFVTVLLAVFRFHTPSLRDEDSHPAERGLVIRWALALLSLAYFFPGLWKLGRGWIDWMSPENLRFVYLDKLIGTNVEAVVPEWVFSLSWIFTLAAVSATFWEFLFPLALLNRWTRIAFGMAGLFFHLTNFVLLQINFLAILVVYIAFFDLKPAVNEATLQMNQALRSGLRSAGLVMVALFTLPGLTAFTAAWPFSCYPTFSRVYGDFRWEIYAEVRSVSNGDVVFEKRVSKNEVLTSRFGNHASTRMTTLMEGGANQKAQVSGEVVGLMRDAGLLTGEQDVSRFIAVRLRLSPDTRRYEKTGDRVELSRLQEDGAWVAIPDVVGLE